MIAMSNEAAANSQQQFRDRSNLSDMCRDEKRRKFSGQRGSTSTTLKERERRGGRDGEGSGQVPAPEGKTAGMHMHTHAHTLGPAARAQTSWRWGATN